jgi:glycerophosphoryl diester phosphodiesterase
MTDWPYLSLEHPIRFAHRGSRILWPENTMHAFARAVEDYEYRYLELDVRVTRDRRVMVFHDATMERVTNGAGKITDWDYAELAALDAAYWFGEDEGYPLRGGDITVPTLEEVYRTWPDVHVNIDLKASDIEWAVAEVVRACGREDSTLIGSFRDRRIARFRRITKGAVATSAGPRLVAAMIAAARAGRTLRSKVQAYQLPYNYRGMKITPRLVDAIHRVDAQIHLWTVDEPEDMHRFLDMGVDGIVTDRPDLLNDAIEERAGDV